jgi:hypothetical protein
MSSMLGPCCSPTTLVASSTFCLCLCCWAPPCGPPPPAVLQPNHYYRDLRAVVTHLYGPLTGVLDPSFGLPSSSSTSRRVPPWNSTIRWVPYPRPPKWTPHPTGLLLEPSPPPHRRRWPDWLAPLPPAPSIPRLPYFGCWAASPSEASPVTGPGQARAIRRSQPKRTVPASFFQELIWEFT